MSSTAHALVMAALGAAAILTGLLGWLALRAADRRTPAH
ncbi:membrane protein [Streptomyces noursei ATCC 11455]|nr:membrane protein [Streptomyces noursei ATCC 11455]